MSDLSELTMLRSEIDQTGHGQQSAQQLLGPQLMSGWCDINTELKTECPPARCFLPNCQGLQAKCCSLDSNFVFGVEAGNVLRSQQERVWVGGGEADGRIWFAQLWAQPGPAWSSLPALGLNIFVAVLTLRELGGRESHVIVGIAGIAAGHNIATDVSPLPPSLPPSWPPPGEMGAGEVISVYLRSREGPSPDYGSPSRHPSSAQTNCPTETCSGCFAVAESP